MVDIDAWNLITADNLGEDFPTLLSPEDAEDEDVENIGDMEVSNSMSMDRVQLLPMRRSTSRNSLVFGTSEDTKSHHRNDLTQHFLPEKWIKTPIKFSEVEPPPREPIRVPVRGPCVQSYLKQSPVIRKILREGESNMYIYIRKIMQTRTLQDQLRQLEYLSLANGFDQLLHLLLQEKDIDIYLVREIGRRWFAYLNMPLIEKVIERERYITLVHGTINLSSKIQEF